MLEGRLRRCGRRGRRRPRAARPRRRRSRACCTAATTRPSAAITSAARPGSPGVQGHRRLGGVGDRRVGGRCAHPVDMRLGELEARAGRHRDEGLRRVALAHVRLDVIVVVALRAQHGDRRLGGLARAAAGLEPVVGAAVGRADRRCDLGCAAPGRGRLDDTAPWRPPGPDRAARHARPAAPIAEAAAANPRRPTHKLPRRRPSPAGVAAPPAACHPRRTERICKAFARKAPKSWAPRGCEEPVEPAGDFTAERLAC